MSDHFPDDKKFTIEELEKFGYFLSCDRCGRHGIQCDKDGDIMYKSRFYNINHLLSDIRVPLDEMYCVCSECLKVVLEEKKKEAEEDSEEEMPLQQHIKEIEKEGWKHTDELEYLSELSKPELKALNEVLFK